MTTVGERWLDAAVTLHGRGQWADAERAYRRAAADAPDHLITLTNLALLHRQTGRAASGVGLLRRVLRLAPGYDPAHYSLGNALGGHGDHQGAGDSFRRALVLSPGHAHAWNNLGNVERFLGRAPQAATLYRRAARALPDFADAWTHYGVACQNSERLAQAWWSLQRASALAPNSAPALLNLANLLMSRGHAGKAEPWYARAVRLNPADADARANWANALRDARGSATAIPQFQVALALDPRHENALNNYGNALNAENQPAAAARLYRRGIAAHPHSALLHFDLGITLLHLGQYAEGWREYEWRWAGGVTPLRDRGICAPLWRGQHLDGGLLLIHVEQGFGDTLQFLRYAPLAAARAGRAALEVQGPLAALAAQAVPNVEIVVKGQKLPACQAHIPLMSLPRIFGTELSTIPADIPYIRPAADKLAFWGDRLGPRDGRLRVGLVWAGSATFKADHLRSPRLAAMAPLLAAPGAQFFALQMGDGRRDLENTALPDDFVDLGPSIADFSDTAAIMGHLDLVISSCTAPAHLAGALGVPTWIILPFAADWRWLSQGEDSPWYPSVRLFRQTAIGSWDETARRVAAALQDAAPGLISDRRLTKFQP